jgi:uncharacterized cofD-like protein
VLRAVEAFAARRTAIIAVTDTGRSTGLARRMHDIPAPGDLRATIAAFADDTIIAQMLQQRLDGEGAPQLKGMAFGNMLLGTMADVLGDFATAVEYVCRLARCSVDVLPVSTANTQLCAELADGTVVETELAVRGLHKAPITQLFLSDDAAAYAPALEAIRHADLVVLGPGSLFTTVLANLLFDGVAEALQAARGAVVYVCNTTTQPGQTDGFRALDHVRWVTHLLGQGTLDAALINNSAPDPVALRQYEAEGLHLLQPDDAEIAEIAALGVRPIVRELTEAVGAKRALWNKQDTVRHDLAALGAVLREVLK